MRSWSRARRSAAGLLLAAVSCNGAEDTASTEGTDVTTGAGATTASTSAGNGSGSGATTGAGGSIPVGETVTLEIEAFDVEPGTERQVCKYFNLPLDAPFDVVRFRSSMEGTSHHLNVYKFLTDPTKPVEPGESMVHDCSPGSEQLSGDAAYIFGSATPTREVQMPSGVAFHLVPQQRIILEQHVINFTGATIQGGVTFEMAESLDKAAIQHHADVIWFANWFFSIPPNQETSVTKRCDVPYDVEVFGLMSHTHQLGSHFSIEKATDQGMEHLYDSTDWAHPIYQQHTPPLSLAAGEGLSWTCTWNNTTASTVFPGKSSTDEMCMTFAYAYPKTGLSGTPIQCN